MYIWQGRTTLGSTTWGSFSDASVFANADGGFSIGVAAKKEGSGATSYTLLDGYVGVLGVGQPSVLQPFQSYIFDPGLAPLIASAPDFPGGHTFAIEKLNNGNWVIAALGDDPESANPSDFLIEISELNPNGAASIGRTYGKITASHAYFDIMSRADSSYQVLVSADYQGPTGNFLTDHRSFTAPGTSIPFSNSTSFASGGDFSGEAVTGTMNSIGQSRVFWMNNSNASTVLYSKFIDKEGNALTADLPLWVRNSGSALSNTRLEAAATDLTSYVAWSVPADANTGNASQMFLGICPNIGPSSLISVESLPGFGATDNRVYDIKVLHDGTLALLSKSGTNFHVSIFSNAGALIDDLSFPVIESGNTMWMTSGENMSVAELSDGRLAIVGESVTDLNLAGLTNQQAHDQNDLSYMIVDPRGASINGTAGDDRIAGRINQFEIVHAGAGDDLVYTMSGAGVVYGESGKDFIIGGADGDVLSGGLDNDLIWGDAGNDELNGDEGDDELHGDADSDYLYGGIGSDTLLGGDDTDFLRGGAGDDKLFGDNGVDLLYGDAGADLLDGGSDQDTVSYMESAAGVDIYLQNLAANSGDAAGDTYAGIERFVLTNYGDVFDAASLTGLIDVQAGGGNDVIYGRTSGLAMYGGDGMDLFSLTGGNNFVQGDETNGTQYLDAIILTNSIRGLGIDMSAASTRDAVYKFLFLGQTQTIKGDVDGVFGSIYGDDISGNLFDNYLNGSLGNDLLVGRGGNDTIEGDEGSDLLFGDDGDDDLSGGLNNDILDGGRGADKLKGDGNDAGGDTVTYQNSLSAVSVDLSAGLGSGGDATGDTLTGIENLTGSKQGDQLKGDAYKNTLNGGLGNDVLDGGLGADVLVGGADLDTAVYSSASGINVSLRTGLASDGDILSQIENLTGSAMGDVLEGDAGANTIRGAAGNDLIIAGSGADNLIGGADLDTVSYETATTGVFANLGTGIGANGGVLSEIENLTGSNFGDVLYGSNIGNTIKGGAGNDFIVGGAGSDALYGGADADTFRYEAAGYGGDVIVDFQDGADKLSFATTLATSFSNFTVAGNGTNTVTLSLAGQAISVQGAAAITLDAGDFLFN